LHDLVQRSLNKGYWFFLQNRFPSYTTKAMMTLLLKITIWFCCYTFTLTQPVLMRCLLSFIPNHFCFMANWMTCSTVNRLVYKNTVFYICFRMIVITSIDLPIQHMLWEVAQGKIVKFYY